MQKKFITYCLLFFLPVIVGYGIVEYFTVNMPNSFSANVNYMDGKESSFENLVLGSSQMRQAINPEWIQQPTLNFASGDQHHDTDFKLIKGIKDRLPNLKTVIFEISYSHFEIPHNGKDFWKNNVYLKYYDINNFERSVYFKDRLSFIAHPSFFSRKMKDYYINKERKEVYNEYGFNINAFHGQFQNVGHDVEKIAAMPSFKINIKPDQATFKKNTVLYFNMMDFLKKHNYNVVVCLVPMYKTYHEKKHPDILRRRDSIVSVTLKKYDNVTLFDLEQDTLNFEVNDYWNQSHLNPVGAKKYTLRLDSLLQTIK